MCAHVHMSVGAPGGQISPGAGAATGHGPPGVATGTQTQVFSKSGSHS